MTGVVHSVQAPPAGAPCRVAICSEPLSDGNAYSVYAINELAETIDVQVTRVEFEWAERSHVTAPNHHVTVPGRGAGLILRVDDGDGEVTMTLSLEVCCRTGLYGLQFELGRLYRYRNPVVIDVIGKPGWLRAADTWRLDPPR